MPAPLLLLLMPLHRGTRLLDSARCRPGLPCVPFCWRCRGEGPAGGSGAARNAGHLPSAGSCCCRGGGSGWDAPSRCCGCWRLRGPGGNSWRCEGLLCCLAFCSDCCVLAAACWLGAAGAAGGGVSLQRLLSLPADAAACLPLVLQPGHPCICCLSQHLPGCLGPVAWQAWAATAAGAPVPAVRAWAAAGAPVAATSAAAPAAPRRRLAPPGHCRRIAQHLPCAGWPAAAPAGMLHRCCWLPQQVRAPPNRQAGATSPQRQPCRRAAGVTAALLEGVARGYGWGLAAVAAAFRSWLRARRRKLSPLQRELCCSASRPGDCCGPEPAVGRKEGGCGGGTRCPDRKPRAERMRRGWRRARPHLPMGLQALRRHC